MYVVYVNDPNSKAKLHLDTCVFYLQRKADYTKRGRWIGLFAKLRSAKNFIQSTGKKDILPCQVCQP